MRGLQYTRLYLMNKSESVISKEIQDYLKSQGLIYWRNQSGQLKVKGGYMRFGINGLSDITVMLNGMHLYIEVKTLTGKQRDAQEAFQIACDMNGHNYMVARSVACVRDKLKELGVL